MHVSRSPRGQRGKRPKAIPKPSKKPLKAQKKRLTTSTAAASTHSTRPVSQSSSNTTHSTIPHGPSNHLDNLNMIRKRNKMRAVIMTADSLTNILLTQHATSHINRSDQPNNTHAVNTNHHLLTRNQSIQALTQTIHNLYSSPPPPPPPLTSSLPLTPTRITPPLLTTIPSISLVPSLLQTTISTKSSDGIQRSDQSQSYRSQQHTRRHKPKHSSSSASFRQTNPQRWDKPFNWSATIPPEQPVPITKQRALKEHTLTVEKLYDQYGGLGNKTYLGVSAFAFSAIYLLFTISPTLDPQHLVAYLKSFEMVKYGVLRGTLSELTNHPAITKFILTYIVCRLMNPVRLVIAATMASYFREKEMFTNVQIANILESDATAIEKKEKIAQLHHYNRHEYGKHDQFQSLSLRELFDITDVQPIPELDAFDFVDPLLDRNKPPEKPLDYIGPKANTNQMIRFFNRTGLPIGTLAMEGTKPIVKEYFDKDDPTRVEYIVVRMTRIDGAEIESIRSTSRNRTSVHIWSPPDENSGEKYQRTDMRFGPGSKLFLREKAKREYIRRHGKWALMGFTPERGEVYPEFKAAYEDFWQPMVLPQTYYDQDDVEWYRYHRHPSLNYGGNEESVNPIGFKAKQVLLEQQKKLDDAKNSMHPFHRLMLEDSMNITSEINDLASQITSLENLEHGVPVQAQSHRLKTNGHKTVSVQNHADPSLLTPSGQMIKDGKVIQFDYDKYPGLGRPKRRTELNADDIVNSLVPRDPRTGTRSGYIFREDPLKAEDRENTYDWIERYHKGHKEELERTPIVIAPDGSRVPIKPTDKEVLLDNLLGIDTVPRETRRFLQYTAHYFNTEKRLGGETVGHQDILDEDDIGKGNGNNTNMDDHNLHQTDLNVNRQLSLLEFALEHQQDLLDAERQLNHQAYMQNTVRPQDIAKGGPSLLTKLTKNGPKALHTLQFIKSKPQWSSFDRPPVVVSQPLSQATLGQLGQGFNPLNSTNPITPSQFTTGAHPSQPAGGFVPTQVNYPQNPLASPHLVPGMKISMGGGGGGGSEFAIMNTLGQTDPTLGSSTGPMYYKPSSSHGTHGGTYQTQHFIQKGGLPQHQQQQDQQQQYQQQQHQQSHPQDPQQQLQNQQFQYVKPLPFDSTNTDNHYGTRPLYNTGHSQPGSDSPVFAHSERYHNPHLAKYGYGNPEIDGTGPDGSTIHKPITLTGLSDKLKGLVGLDPTPKSLAELENSGEALHPEDLRELKRLRAEMERTQGQNYNDFQNYYHVDELGMTQYNLNSPQKYQQGQQHQYQQQQQHQYQQQQQHQYQQQQQQQQQYQHQLDEIPQLSYPEPPQNYSTSTKLNNIPHHPYNHQEQQYEIEVDNVLGAIFNDNIASAAFDLDHITQSTPFNFRNRAQEQLEVYRIQYQYEEEQFEKKKNENNNDQNDATKPPQSQQQEQQEQQQQQQQQQQPSQDFKSFSHYLRDEGKKRLQARLYENRVKEDRLYVKHMEGKLSAAEFEKHTKTLQKEQKDLAKKKHKILSQYTESLIETYPPGTELIDDFKVLITPTHIPKNSWRGGREIQTWNKMTNFAQNYKETPEDQKDWRNNDPLSNKHGTKNDQEDGKSFFSKIGSSFESLLPSKLKKLKNPSKKSLPDPITEIYRRRLRRDPNDDDIDLDIWEEVQLEFEKVENESKRRIAKKTTRELLKITNKENNEPVFTGAGSSTSRGFTKISSSKAEIDMLADENSRTEFDDTGARRRSVTAVVAAGGEAEDEFDFNDLENGNKKRRFRPKKVVYDPNDVFSQTLKEIENDDPINDPFSHTPELSSSSSSSSLQPFENRNKPKLGELGSDFGYLDQDADELALRQALKQPTETTQKPTTQYSAFPNHDPVNAYYNPTGLKHQILHPEDNQKDGPDGFFAGKKAPFAQNRTNRQHVDTIIQQYTQKIILPPLYPPSQQNQPSQQGQNAPASDGYVMDIDSQLPQFATQMGVALPPTPPPPPPPASRSQTPSQQQSLEISLDGYSPQKVPALPQHLINAFNQQRQQRIYNHLHAPPPQPPQFKAPKPPTHSHPSELSTHTPLSPDHLTPHQAQYFDSLSDPSKTVSVDDKISSMMGDDLVTKVNADLRDTEFPIYIPPHLFDRLQHYRQHIKEVVEGEYDDYLKNYNKYADYDDYLVKKALKRDDGQEVSEYENDRTDEFGKLKKEAGQKDWRTDIQELHNIRRLEAIAETAYDPREPAGSIEVMMNMAPAPITILTPKEKEERLKMAKKQPWFKQMSTDKNLDELLELNAAKSNDEIDMEQFRIEIPGFDDTVDGQLRTEEERTKAIFDEYKQILSEAERLRAGLYTTESGEAVNLPKEGEQAANGPSLLSEQEIYYRLLGKFPRAAYIFTEASFLAKQGPSGQYAGAIRLTDRGTPDEPGDPSLRPIKDTDDTIHMMKSKWVDRLFDFDRVQLQNQWAKKHLTSYVNKSAEQQAAKKRELRAMIDAGYNIEDELDQDRLAALYKDIKTEAMVTYNETTKRYEPAPGHEYLVAPEKRPKNIAEFFGDGSADGQDLNLKRGGLDTVDHFFTNVGKKITDKKREFDSIKGYNIEKDAENTKSVADSLLNLRLLQRHTSTHDIPFEYGTWRNDRELKGLPSTLLEFQSQANRHLPQSMDQVSLQEDQEDFRELGENFKRRNADWMGTDKRRETQEYIDDVNNETLQKQRRLDELYTRSSNPLGLDEFGPDGKSLRGPYKDGEDWNRDMRTPTVKEDLDRINNDPDWNNNEKMYKDHREDLPYEVLTPDGKYLGRDLDRPARVGAWHPSWGKDTGKVKRPPYGPDFPWRWDVDQDEELPTDDEWMDYEMDSPHKIPGEPGYPLKRPKRVPPEAWSAMKRKQRKFQIYTALRDKFNPRPRPSQPGQIYDKIMPVEYFLEEKPVFNEPQWPEDDSEYDAGDMDDGGPTMIDFHEIDRIRATKSLWGKRVWEWWLQTDMPYPKLSLMEDPFQRRLKINPDLPYDNNYFENLEAERPFWTLDPAQLPKPNVPINRIHEYDHPEMQRFAWRMRKIGELQQLIIRQSLKVFFKNRYLMKNAGSRSFHRSLRRDMIEYHLKRRIYERDMKEWERNQHLINVREKHMSRAEKLKKAQRVGGPAGIAADDEDLDDLLYGSDVIPIVPKPQGPQATDQQYQYP